MRIHKASRLFVGEIWQTSANEPYPRHIQPGVNNDLEKMDLNLIFTKPAVD